MSLSPVWVGAHPNNFTIGRNGRTIKRLIVHSTQGTLQATANHFNNPKAKVSAHYGIGKKRELEQYVKLADTAHHAGNWKINLESVGIEFEDIYDGVEHNPVQYDLGAELIAALCKRFKLGKPSSSNVEPHNKYRATLCPADLDVQKLISLAQVKYELLFKEPDPKPQSKKVRLFDPVHNRQIGTGTLVGDKVYLIKIDFKGGDT